MPPRPQKTYFVYIMTNRSKTLYTGVTNSLVRRASEHKLGIGSSFAAKYKLDRLVCISNASTTYATPSSAKSKSKAGCESRKSR